MKYYAGIGSRKISREIEELMKNLAIRLQQEGYILRSGGAEGSDQAFEAGATSKEIFRSNDAQPWAMEYAKENLPNDRSSFDQWTPYVKGLMGRNMMQILGKDGNSPVDFVICYAPSTFYEDSSAGGTGYAIRCALKKNIPIFNLYEKNIKYTITQFLNQDRSFSDWMRELITEIPAEPKESRIQR